MVLLGISTTVGSMNFVVTFLRMRAPGMSVDRVPVLVWGTLTASGGNLLAVPSVSLAFFLLWLDRRIGTHFFDVMNGGRALLWQHLFWIFAHPWVYAVVLPAMGIVSDALPVFCRRPLVGYLPVATVDGRDHDGRLRRVDSSHVRDRHSRARAVVLRRGEHGHRDTERRRDLRVDRDDLDRAARVPRAVPLFRGLRFPVRDRRPLWRADRRRAARLAADRHLLRRRAPALRAARHQRLSGDRRHLLLVPEVHGTHDERAHRARRFLDPVRGLQRRVLPDAHRGSARHAAPDLYLCAGHGLEHGEHDHVDRRVRVRARRAGLPGRLRVQPAPRTSGAATTRGTRPRSNGRPRRRRRPTTSPSSPRIASRHPLWEERLSGRMRSQLDGGLRARPRTRSARHDRARRRP